MATREPVIDTGPRRAVGSLPSANGPVFAWRTDEWHLSPETLAVSKANAQGGLNGGGSTRGVHAATGRGHGVVEGETLCVPLVAVHEHGKKQTLSPKQPSANTSPTQSEGYGASPLGRRRKGSVPRTCSANGCCTDVLDRAQGLVVMCPAHRRVTSGVAVDCDGGDGELMRWCYHCKKAHSLAAFADSVIGVSRKLATCERGRAARRAAFAKKAADQQTASVEDDARTGDTAATVFNHDEFFALGGGGRSRSTAARESKRGVYLRRETTRVRYGSQQQPVGRPEIESPDLGVGRDGARAGAPRRYARRQNVVAKRLGGKHANQLRERVARKRRVRRRGR